MPKNILIIGADGLIGSSLINYLSKIPDHSVYGTSRKLGSKFLYLDITSDEVLWPKLDELDLIVLCAGIAKIEKCQENESLSYAVHIIGLKKIISKYKSSKTKIIFLSSSHVFSGKKSFVKENDKIEPQNIYGAHRALAEKIILNNNGLIIRVTKVIDPNFPLFDGWISKLKRDETIIAFNNLFASLVPLDSLIRTISIAIKNEWSGIVHLSGPEDVSYHEIAKILARKLKYNKKLIISTKGVIKVPGVFQLKTTLKTSNIIKKHKIYLPNTEKLLEDFLDIKNI
jgi:dTDP-4-dehydrorhamnose reductase